MSCLCSFPSFVTICSALIGVTCVLLVFPSLWFLICLLLSVCLTCVLWFLPFFVIVISLACNILDL